MHAASIAEARRARGRGRPRWAGDLRVARAGLPGSELRPVCFFDCLHDMGDPVAAARHAAEVLAPDGTIMLVEPFANDRVEDNISPVARLYYAALHHVCCAHAISEGGPLVLGAQAGEKRADRRVPQGRVHALPPRGGDAVQPGSMTILHSPGDGSGAQGIGASVTPRRRRRDAGAPALGWLCRECAGLCLGSDAASVASG